ncbi:MAG: hypothetical protein ACYDBP_14690 [Leptospirales bacterium]
MIPRHEEEEGQVRPVEHIESGDESGIPLSDPKYDKLFETPQVSDGDSSEDEDRPGPGGGK